MARGTPAGRSRPTDWGSEDIVIATQLGRTRSRVGKTGSSRSGLLLMTDWGHSEPHGPPTKAGTAPISCPRDGVVVRPPHQCPTAQLPALGQKSTVVTEEVFRLPLLCSQLPITHKGVVEGGLVPAHAASVTTISTVAASKTAVAAIDAMSVATVATVTGIGARHATSYSAAGHATGRHRSRHPARHLTGHLPCHSRVRAGHSRLRHRHALRHAGVHRHHRVRVRRLHPGAAWRRRKLERGGLERRLGRPAAQREGLFGK